MFLKRSLPFGMHSRGREWIATLSRKPWLAASVVLAAPVLLVLILALIAAGQEGDYRREYARSQVRNLALLLSEDLGARLRDLDDELRAEALLGRPVKMPQATAAPSGAAQLDGPLQDATGRWVMRLSRAVSAGDARRVSRDVPVDELGAALSRVELGQHGAATIRTLDLRLVYRHPLPPGGLNRIGDAKVSNELTQAVLKSASRGEFVARTALDGIARVNAYRQLEGYPLMVLVGVAESDFPSGWGRIDQPLFALALLTLISLAGAIWALQRASARALSDAGRRYDTIVEQSNDAIVSRDLQGTVLTWNAAAQRILGWSPQEMLGRSIRTLIPPDWAAQEAEWLQRMHRGEPVQAEETERLHKRGHRVPMAITLSPLRDAQGRIIGCSTISRDISQQKAMERAIRDMAYRDALTGLPNRRYALEQLGLAQALSRRSGHWHGLVFLDLDGLKAINDTLGHQEGDRYLKEAADRLVRSLRESDQVARLGGDEFVVLCLNLGGTEAQARQALGDIERKLRHEMAQPWPVRTEERTIGASIGVVAFDGRSAAAAEDILREADERMYADKQARRAPRVRALSDTSLAPE